MTGREVYRIGRDVARNVSTKTNIKQILLTSCLFLWFFIPISIYAQNECDRYILKVDSLIKADNLSIYRRNKPDSQCENALLDFTKGKGYLGDSTEFYIDRLPEGVLEKARLWMKENKGNYILNPDFPPSFHNLILKPYRNKDNRK